MLYTVVQGVHFAAPKMTLGSVSFSIIVRYRLPLEELTWVRKAASASLVCFEVLDPPGFSDDM